MRCSCGREFTPKSNPRKKNKDVAPEEIYCSICLSSSENEEGVFDREYEHGSLTISLFDKFRR